MNGFTLEKCQIANNDIEILCSLIQIFWTDFLFFLLETQPGLPENAFLNMIVKLQRRK